MGWDDKDVVVARRQTRWATGIAIWAGGAAGLGRLGRALVGRRRGRRIAHVRRVFAIVLSVLEPRGQTSTWNAASSGMRQERCNGVCQITRGRVAPPRQKGIEAVDICFGGLRVSSKGDGGKVGWVDVVSSCVCMCVCVCVCVCVRELSILGDFEPVAQVPAYRSFVVPADVLAKLARTRTVPPGRVFLFRHINQDQAGNHLK